MADSSPDGSISINEMLQEAGLDDIQAYPDEDFGTHSNSSAQQGSGPSESQSESLDGTSVLLGDSDDSTQAMRFIKKQWGPKGTMIKIFKLIKNGPEPVTIYRLVSEGPVLFGYKRMIAARCFTSVLQLKQHGFLEITKIPNSNEIDEIHLGSRFMRNVEFYY